MKPGGRDADQNVADANLGAVDDFLVIDQTDRKSGEIVFIFRVKPRHFGCFPADQRAVGDGAAFAYTFYNFGRDSRVQLSHG